MTYWGYHLMLDCSRCGKALINSEENIRSFIKELVINIDMVSYGDPMVAHFATHDPDKAGFSFCQMIETSNICGHFVDKNGNAYIDVFSCKPFDNNEVIKTVEKYFSPEKIRLNYITRNAD